jgi:hypothetical protein
LNPPNFTGELGAVFLKLFARRFELMAEKNKIAILDNQIAEFGKERDRILEMIKQHNIEGIVDDRRWQVLQRNFEFEQGRTNDAIARRGELSNSLYPKQLEFMQECAPETARLGKLLVPVLTAAREELELPFDEKSYHHIVDDGFSKQKLAIDEFVRRFMPAVAQPVVADDVPRAAQAN